MKRLAAMLFLALVMLTACGQEPAVTEPVTTTKPQAETPKEYDYVYDMSGHRWLSDLFEEHPDVDWDARGEYTMLLEGLHTPVELGMDGQDVMTVSIYGHTKEVVIYTYEGEANMDIIATKDMVVINDDSDYFCRAWVFTPEECIELIPEGSISTRLSLQEDGTLSFTRFWGPYNTTFHQEDYAPLYQCTSREHFLYEKGTAQIVDGKLTLNAEQTVVLEDEYDLDELFAEAKAQGLFAEYDNVDDVLKANAKR